MPRKTCNHLGFCVWKEDEACSIGRAIVGPAPPFWQQTFCFKSDIENLILKESTHLRITGKLTTLTLKLNFKVINPLPTDLRKGGGFFFSWLLKISNKSAPHAPTLLRACQYTYKWDRFISVTKFKWALWSMGLLRTALFSARFVKTENCVSSSQFSVSTNLAEKWVSL